MPIKNPEARKAYFAEYRKNNREKINALCRKWRENNKEKVKAYNEARSEAMKPYHRQKAVEWRVKNREKHRAYNKDWYARNKTSATEYANRWWAAHPDKRLESTAAYLILRGTKFKKADIPPELLQFEIARISLKHKIDRKRKK